MNFAEWNQGLLVSVVLVVVGGMLLAGASSLRGRLIAIGTLSQAVVLAFVANGAFHGRSDPPLAALVLASLFVLWSLLALHGRRDDEATHKTGLTLDDLPSREALPARADLPPDDRAHAEEGR